MKLAHGITRLFFLFALGALGAASAQTATGSCIPITSAPFTITLPGSYCLTQHTTSYSHGITIQASDVTIDLGGYTLRYAGSNSPSTAVGIYRYANDASPTLYNVSVVNGTIVGFISGVQLQKIANAKVENLRIDCDPLGATSGIALTRAAGPMIIRNNQITQVRWGVIVSRIGAGSSMGGLIQNNLITLLGLVDAPRYANPYGISLEVISGVRVDGNTIQNASGIIGTGIVTYSTVPVATISDNVISSVATGISVNAMGVKYKNNTVTDATTPYRGGTSLGGNN